MDPAEAIRWRDIAWAALLLLVSACVVSAAGGPVALVVSLGLLMPVLVLWHRRLLRSAPVVGQALCGLLGCAVLLVSLDWAFGVLLSLDPFPSETDRDQPGDEVLDLTDVDLPPARDPRVHDRAMAGAPWADRYFAEMEALDYEYVPFIGPRESPVRGRYINGADGVRRSYVPPGADEEEAVDVWFFGGSTMWGEGQRDLHTIPSMVARLAERDGVSLRVVNFGQRGYTAFQEFLLFEQELEQRESPDAVVFYDGVNELGTQRESLANLGSQPTMYQLEVTGRAFERAPPVPRASAQSEPSVVKEYLDTSAVHQLARGARSLASVPSAAAQAFPPFEPDQRAAAISNAASIYRRSVSLIDHVADRHDLDPLYFWQPSFPPPQNVDYYALGDRVEGVGIDISDALLDPPSPVFIDLAHTNELGARLVAEVLWPHIQRSLDQTGGI